jgi:hypothetical protein
MPLADAISAGQKTSIIRSTAGGPYTEPPVSTRRNSGDVGEPGELHKSILWLIFSGFCSSYELVTDGGRSRAPTGRALAFPAPEMVKLAPQMQCGATRSASHEKNQRETLAFLAVGSDISPPGGTTSLRLGQATRLCITPKRFAYSPQPRTTNFTCRGRALLAVPPTVATRKQNDEKNSRSAEVSADANDLDKRNKIMPDTVSYASTTSQAAMGKTSAAKFHGSEATTERFRPKPLIQPNADNVLHAHSLCAFFDSVSMPPPKFTANSCHIQWSGP